MRRDVAQIPTILGKIVCYVYICIHTVFQDRVYRFHQIFRREHDHTFITSQEILPLCIIFLFGQRESRTQRVRIFPDKGRKGSCPLKPSVKPCTAAWTPGAGTLCAPREVQGTRLAPPGVSRWCLPSPGPGPCCPTRAHVVGSTARAGQAPAYARWGRSSEKLRWRPQSWI